jgi:hypothetical protein
MEGLETEERKELGAVRHDLDLDLDLGPFHLFDGPYEQSSSLSSVASSLSSLPSSAS